MRSREHVNQHRVAVAAADIDGHQVAGVVGEVCGLEDVFSMNRVRLRKGQRRCIGTVFVVAGDYG